MVVPFPVLAIADSAYAQYQAHQKTEALRLVVDKRFNFPLTEWSPNNPNEIKNVQAAIEFAASKIQRKADYRTGANVSGFGVGVGVGATVGSIVPGAGTLVGAAVGGAIGFAVNKSMTYLYRGVRANTKTGRGEGRSKAAEILWRAAHPMTPDEIRNWRGSMLASHEATLILLGREKGKYWLSYRSALASKDGMIADLKKSMSTW